MVTQQVNWVGRRVADGRYRIIERLDKGSMGHVYRAYDGRLETEVVLKFPVAADARLEGADFLERFNREIRSLVKLSHPHIVKIIDVGAEQGAPYVVMQFLTGGSLKSRMETGPGGEPQPMPMQSLVGWLQDVGGALDFIHSQGYVHRDVKPANIMFDQHGHAFLGDFGLIKGLASANLGNDSSLTGAGLLVGTPNYIAPEIVMGHEADGRADQYSLAMSVHEVLTGCIFLEGPTPSATMVNQTKVHAPALAEVVPGTPPSLSAAVARALSKDPRRRFDTCVAFAQAALADVPGGSSRSSSGSLLGRVSRGALGQSPCPSCRAVLPVAPIHNEKRIRCSRCRGISLVQIADNGGVQLTLVASPSATMSGPRPDVSGSLVGIPRPDTSGSLIGGSRPRLQTPSPSLSRSSMPNAAGPSYPAGPNANSDIGAPMPQPPKTRRVLLQRLAAAAVAGTLTLAACAFIWRGGPSSAGGNPPIVDWGGMVTKGERPTPPIIPTLPPPPPIIPTPPPAPEKLTINIAFGTEKEKWLKAALKEYEATPAGAIVKINLVGLGSVEGAQAVLSGPNAVIDGKPIPPIHVWSPASAAYRDVFEQEWQLRNGNKPILKAEPLALTPMVFVMWKERYEAFVKKYPRLSFTTMGQAMQLQGGWAGIARKPEWGLFNFAHTDPLKSNSGMLALVLMAYDFTNKERGLTVSDITDSEFQSWFRRFEQGVARPPDGRLTHSTGSLMKEMVLRGPSQYDCLVLYENLAIDYLKQAQEHWGELQVAYPEPNLWNEHPYYVLDVPWSGEKQRKAAEDFLEFLLTEPIQRKALDHGFRPANPSVPVRFPESPLVKNADHGLKIDVPRLAESPKADVVKGLLDLFKRSESR